MLPKCPTKVNAGKLAEQHSGMRTQTVSGGGILETQKQRLPQYTGDLFKGRPHGSGREITANGQWYEGTFAAGHRHGTGTLYMPIPTDDMTQIGVVRTNDVPPPPQSAALSLQSHRTYLCYTGEFHLGLMHGKGFLRRVAEDTVMTVSQQITKTSAHSSDNNIYDNASFDDDDDDQKRIERIMRDTEAIAVVDPDNSDVQHCNDTSSSSSSPHAFTIKMKIGEERYRGEFSKGEFHGEGSYCRCYDAREGDSEEALEISIADDLTPSCIAGSKTVASKTVSPTATLPTRAAATLPTAVTPNAQLCVEMYRGAWVDGAKHGHGRWEEDGEYGDIYEGEYQGDLRHGRGVYTTGDGASYDGEWRYGMMWGYGVHEDSQGEVYAGEFVRNKQVGS